MVTTSSKHDIAGYDAHVTTFMPECEVRACAILIHGQGDFGNRYDHVAAIFCARRIAVYAVDLPGHGLTNGEHGDIPSLAVAEEFIDHAYSKLSRDFPDLPIGLLAHSMGGQLALRELLVNTRKYAFCWMNGPLLYPAKRKHPIELLLLRLLAKIASRFTISTKVKRSDCESLSSKKDNPLFHSRVSLRWGLALIRSAEQNSALAAKTKVDIPVLVTQGEFDVVNPTRYADEFFKGLPWEKLNYVLIPGALHEPFQDDGSKVFEGVLADWVRDIF